eukprot:1157217-Pelagomonas_calceolata.AAC.13
MQDECSNRYAECTQQRRMHVCVRAGDVPFNVSAGNVLHASMCIIASCASWHALVLSWALCQLVPQQSHD